MCGRYFFSDMTTDEKLTAIVNMMDRSYLGMYKTGEIFPGDTAPAVVDRQGRLIAVPAVFGFPGSTGSRLLINARSETAAEKPAFAESLRHRRIILPAAGFFEWSHDGKKTKYYFRAGHGGVSYLCGVFRVIGGQCRFVILTRPAGGAMLGIHDRMPVIASEAQVRPYLTDYDAARALIAADGPALLREPAVAAQA